MKRISIQQFCILFTVFCLLLSCGSRSVKTTKTAEEIHKKEVVETQVEVVKKTQVENEKKVAESYQRTAESEIQKQATENEVRQRAKVNKKTVYYPNGQIKSQTESTETESETIAKQRLEIDNLRSSAIALKEETETLKQENNTLKQEKETLSKQVKELKKGKKKDADREAYPWYWWVIGAVIVWEFLKLLWRNYFKYLIKIR